MRALPQLDLSDNGLGCKGGKVLAPAIRNNQFLTECNLSANDLREEGWCAIFDELSVSPQNTIVKWDLAYQMTDVKTIKSQMMAISRYMAVSRSLTLVLVSFSHSYTQAVHHRCCAFSGQFEWQRHAV